MRCFMLFLGAASFSPSFLWGGGGGACVPSSSFGLVLLSTSLLGVVLFPSSLLVVPFYSSFGWSCLLPKEEGAARRCPLTHLVLRVLLLLLHLLLGWGSFSILEEERSTRTPRKKEQDNNYRHRFHDDLFFLSFLNKKEGNDNQHFTGKRSYSKA